MATISERLAYILTADNKQFVSSFQQAGATADKELGKADSKLDKLGGNLTKVGAGAVAFAGVAGAGLFKLAQGAANTEASFSSLNQVVGSSIANGLADWAKEGAENLGLAEGQIFSAATAFGSLGKIAGFAGEDLDGFIRKQLTLSADMAAFADTSPDQVIQDLRAAYAGSSETLQKYNVFVNDANIKAAIFSATGEKVTGVLTSQQRVMGINLLLTEQTVDMQGQWNRESGELAGQQAQLSANMKNLADNIGKGVLPMATSLVGVLNKAATAFAELSPETQATAGRLAAIGVIGVGLLGTLSLVAGQVIKMRTRFQEADGTLNTFGKTAKGLGITLGVVAVALVAWEGGQQRLAGSLRDSIRLTEQLSRVTEEALAETFLHAVAAATMGGKSLEDALSMIAEANLEGAKRALEHADAIGLNAAETAKLKAAIDAEVTARKTQVKTTEEYGDAEEEVTEAVEASASATENLKAEMEGGISVTELAEQREKSLAKAIDAKAEADAAAEDAARAHTEALEEQRRKTDELHSAKAALVGGDIAVREAQRAAGVAVDELNALIDEGTASTDELSASQDNAALAVLGAAQAAADLRVAQAEANGETTTAATKNALMRDELSKVASTLEPGSPLRLMIEGYIKDLDAIPDEVKTSFTISARGATVTPHGDLIGIGGPRAAGGPTFPNTLHEVTERGSELLHEGGKTYLMSGANGQVEPLPTGGVGTPANGTGLGVRDIHFHSNGLPSVAELSTLFTMLRLSR